MHVMQLFLCYSIMCYLCPDSLSTSAGLWATSVAGSIRATCALKTMGLWEQGRKASIGQGLFQIKTGNQFEELTQLGGCDARRAFDYVLILNLTAWVWRWGNAMLLLVMTWLLRAHLIWGPISADRGVGGKYLLHHIDVFHWWRWSPKISKWQYYFDERQASVVFVWSWQLCVTLFSLIRTFFEVE